MTKCETCRKQVESAEALRCKHPYCTKRTEVEREVKAAQQKKWAQEREEEQKGWTIVIPSPDDWTSDQ